MVEIGMLDQWPAFMAVEVAEVTWVLHILLVNWFAQGPEN